MTEATAVLARTQTGGRGRLGRSFASPPGGAYFSVLYRTALGPEDLASMTVMAAVAVCRGIEEVCPLHPVIKWPNDVLLSGRKVCGILCESIFDAAGAGIVIGAGVNVRRAAFPPELQETVTTLEDESGTAPEPEAVALAVLREMDAWAADWPERREEAMAAYRLRCDTLGREIVWQENGAERHGTAQAHVADVRAHRERNRQNCLNNHVSLLVANAYRTSAMIAGLSFEAERNRYSSSLCGKAPTSGRA